MIRFTSRVAAGLLAVFAMAACSDAPNAPATFSTVDLSGDPRAQAPASAPVFPRSTGASAQVAVYEPAGTLVGDTTVVAFNVLYRKEAVYLLGRHWIYFSPNSICDPNKTAYGEGEWNNSCQPAKRDIPITAKIYADSNGRPVVSFEPHLRFDPTKYVILHMTFDIAGMSEPKILWFKKEFNGQNGVDEASNDEALITQKDDQLLVYRRIKHFSGYTVSTGFLRDDTTLEGSVDVSLSAGREPVGPTSLNSGHVVATGAISPQPEQ